MAMPNATLEQVSIVESTPTEAPAPSRRAPTRETLRERIARYLAGTAPASNYEAMCQAIAADFSGRPPCEACEGNGYRKLARHVVEQLDERLEHQLSELERKRAALAAAEADAHRPRKSEDIEERLRQEAVKDADRLRGEIIRLEESMGKDRDARIRRARCRACAGSGRGPRQSDGDAGRPDSMFSTVTCRSCRGIDARRHPRLLNRHHGSSSGELRLRGPRLVDGSVVSHPRDDAAAEQHDVCPVCRGDDGQGTGYVVPITCRPTQKTAGTPDDVPVESDDHFPDTEFEEPALDAHEPDGFLETTRREDPLLAAGIAAFLGTHGDEWSSHTWQRRFALWPLTEDGRRLATESRLATSAVPGYERLLDLCRLERHAELESAAGSPRRRALMRRADEQARLLERRVERALSEADAA